MTRRPASLKEAREIVREERIKVTSSVSAIAGSRWLTAILATFVIAFAAHVAYAPTRLPPVGGISLATVGLPPSVDFGFAGEQAEAARDAAVRQGAPGRVSALIDQNADKIPLFNAIGFGSALILLLANMWIMTKRRRATRG